LLKIQDAKNRHLGTIPQLRLRTVGWFGAPEQISIGQSEKKLVRQRYLLFVSSQYGERCQLTAEMLSGVWGTRANFNWFHVLAALLHCTPAVGVSQTLRH